MYSTYIHVGSRERPQWIVRIVGIRVLGLLLGWPNKNLREAIRACVVGVAHASSTRAAASASTATVAAGTSEAESTPTSA